MLQYLVNDMLDLFQIKKDKFKKNEQSVDIKKQIGMLMELMKVQCYIKGLELEVNIDPDVPEKLVLDIQRLRQVYLNLLQNAIKFTYEGKITLELKYNPQTLYLTGKVRDTGIGISEED